MTVKINYHNHLSLNYGLKLSMPKNLLSPKSLTHMSIYRLMEKKTSILPLFNKGIVLEIAFSSPCLVQKINLSPLFLAVLVLTSHSLYYELIIFNYTINTEHPRAFKEIQVPKDWIK